MLHGRTALITGGSSGIGFATARQLQENGARVAITGTNADKLESARAELGDAARAIRADVTSQEDLSELQQELGDAFGSLDILFANAGVTFGTPTDSTDEAMYDRLMDVNVKGVSFFVQAALPLMPPGSSIILITS